MSRPLSLEQSWRYYLLFTSFSQDKIFFFFSPGPGGWRMWRLCSPRMYDSTINQYIQQKAAFIMLEDLWGSDLTANNPESISFWMRIHFISDLRPRKSVLKDNAENIFPDFFNRTVHEKDKMVIFWRKSTKVSGY